MKVEIEYDNITEFWRIRLEGVEIALSRKETHAKLIQSCFEVATSSMDLLQDLERMAK